MPAVSTKRHVVPPSSMSSSTGSRVVPATGSTSERSCPASLLSRLDLPTFGRPRSATRRGPPSSSSASFGASGSASRITSSRSPLPRPCSALTGTGSPSPSDQSAATSGSALVSSTLLAATTTGLPDRRSTAATAAAAAVTPTVASPTNRKAGAGAARLPAARVDQGERTPVPDRVVGDPVPGHPRSVLDDRLPAAQDPVHQRGLAH